MDILDTVGEVFGMATGKVERFVTKLFGSSNERRVRNIGFAREKDGSTSIIPGSTLDRINQLEPDYEKLSDAELRGSASKFRAQLADGKTLDELLPDAFAAMRESSKRYLKMRHYDVQMLGGYILHKGQIAEMVTGEGKTLVSTLPAFLNGLAGKVHVVTVNDYLAKRDMEWMGPAHLGLGLTVGAIQSFMAPHDRLPAYACDITYGTNNEFGFDYLRDNMKPTREQQAQGRLDFAIVDEIDNILIDEARTPLIISGSAADDITKYPKADWIARQLKRDVHFEVKEKEHTCHLTDEGIRQAEQLAGVESFYTTGNMEWPHLIDNALKAHFLYKLDVNYVVEGGEVVIVDEFTGRKMPGRQWSDGLHQSVEAKEGVQIKEESQTLATITLQNYFKLYKKLGGMTGTAMTESEEFWRIYKLDVVSIPTNRPMKRVNFPDVIFRSEHEKWTAITDEIQREHATGRPLLVGTVSIEKSEHLSQYLKKYGIKHEVLNAKNHEREAEIISQAGRLNAVTIATNMAGRGTDIILGGNPEYPAWKELNKKYATRLDVPKAEWDALTKEISDREGMAAEGRQVAEVGGLHVIGSERHDARRIDLQLRGRAGRQGDPGSSRFFLSLEDDLMRKFAGDWVKNILTRMGMQDGEAIESKMVTKRIEAAQKKVEEHHFDVRKNLLEYDEVMDQQRKQVYSYRQRILDGRNCRQLVLDMIAQQVDQWVRHFWKKDYRWDSICSWAKDELHIKLEVDDIRDMDREPFTIYLRDQASRQYEDQILEAINENLSLADEESNWNWQAMARWADTQFGGQLTDSDLRKVGRDDLFDFIRPRAMAAIDKFDLSPLDTLMHPQFCQLSLSSWLGQQFGLRCDPADLDSRETEKIIVIVQEKLEKHLQAKEIAFPVEIAINTFLNSPGVQNDSGALLERILGWANARFRTNLQPEEFNGQTLDDLAKRLYQLSSEYFGDGSLSQRLKELLNQTYPAPNLDDKLSGPILPNADGLASLVNWANEVLQLGCTAEDLRRRSREDVEQMVLAAYDSRFRPEMSHTERTLILEVLDSAWKEHLYYMDYVRAGIGLSSYAQKDPKTEYRREGVAAFQQMWKTIAMQVTSAIFRIERESSGVVESVFQESAASHAEFREEDAAPPVAIAQDEVADDHRTNSSEPTPPAVQPIRNYGPQVGRNDPCPCGSGKKFKKCHGAIG
ncbi:MAG: preprotein translocase subunit SecA [Planctomycetaceae bacterium]